MSSLQQRTRGATLASAAAAAVLVGVLLVLHLARGARAQQIGSGAAAGEAHCLVSG